MHQEIKATVIWLLLAFFLTFAGFWQAKVVVAQDTHSQHRQLPPPAKTKLATRPPPEVFTGDVVADYIARCEKGMTDQEIGWILEDFRNAGLDLDWQNPAVTDEEVLRYRKTLDRWYHDALVDGLRLSPEQSAELTSKLAEFFEQLNHPYPEEASTPTPTDGQLDKFASINQDKRDWLGNLSRSMITFTSVPIATPYYPWILCQLTPEQEGLTGKRWFPVIENGELDIPHGAVSNLPGGPNFLSEDLTDAEYPIDESLDLQSGLPNLIFPLLSQQKLIAKNDPNDVFSEPSDPPGQSALENVRLLHPCQFKALLLFNPQLLPILQTQLNQPSR
jgi:hypothetical protein